MTMPTMPISPSGMRPRRVSVGPSLHDGVPPSIPIQGDLRLEEVFPADVHRAVPEAGRSTHRGKVGLATVEIGLDDPGHAVR